MLAGLRAKGRYGLGRAWEGPGLRGRAAKKIVSQPELHTAEPMGSVSRFPTSRYDVRYEAGNLLVRIRAATGGPLSPQENEVAEFIVIHGQFHQPVIINIDAVAVARKKTESNGSNHMEIVMTSGIIVATDMTFEDLTKRLRSSPA